MLLLWLFSFCLFVLSYSDDFCFVLLYHILSYYYPVHTCLLSKKTGSDPNGREDKEEPGMGKWSGKEKLKLEYFIWKKYFLESGL